MKNDIFMNTILLDIVYIHEGIYFGHTFGGPLSDKCHGGNATFHFHSRHYIFIRFKTYLYRNGYL